MIVFMLSSAYDKVVVEEPSPPLPVHRKDEKPHTPVPLGCIRGYFGDYYKTFTQHIEKVQPIDSFSNAYFYWSCNDALYQINLINSDSAIVVAMYITGYSPDSLPATLPESSEYGKYTEIQFYALLNWKSVSNGHYSLDDFYGKIVFITDNTDDVLTGTFKGILISATGDIIPVSESEFKIKNFRKYMPCGMSNWK